MKELSKNEEYEVISNLFKLSDGQQVTINVNSERTMLSRWKKLKNFFSNQFFRCTNLFPSDYKTRYKSKNDHIDAMVLSNWASAAYVNYFKEEYDIIEKISENNPRIAAYNVTEKRFVKPSRCLKPRIVIYETSDLEDMKRNLDYYKYNYDFICKYIPEVAELNVPFIAFWVINEKGEIGRWLCIGSKEFKSHKERTLDDYWVVRNEYCKSVFGTIDTCNFKDSIRYKKITNDTLKLRISSMKLAMNNPSSIELKPATEKQKKYIENLTDLAPEIINKLNVYQASEIISYLNSDDDYLGMNKTEFIDWYRKIK